MLDKTLGQRLDELLEGKGPAVDQSAEMMDIMSQAYRRFLVRRREADKQRLEGTKQTRTEVIELARRRMRSENR